MILQSNILSEIELIKDKRLTKNIKGLFLTGIRHKHIKTISDLMSFIELKSDLIFDYRIFKVQNGTSYNEIKEKFVCDTMLKVKIFVLY
jgi:hypothetical protein